MTTRTLPERLLVCLVVATVAIAPLTGGAVAAPFETAGVEQTDPADELALDVTNETDDTVTVTLSTTVEDVAGYQAHLQFDPEATVVQSVSGGEGPFSADPVTNVDNENGSVNFNQVADNTSAGTDAPTMATIVFEAADEPTDVTFVSEDSLVATSEAEAVTDLVRDGVSLDNDSGDGSDGGDGGDGSDGGDGGDGSDGGDGGDGSDGGDGGDGSDGGTSGTSGTGGAPSGDDGPSSVEADVTTTAAGASLSAADVAAGSTVGADFGDAVAGDALTVDRLSIETTTDIESMAVDARALDAADLPDGTPALDDAGSVSYVEFETAGFDSEDVASATVSFTADAEAIGAAPEDVTLFRFADGEWTQLETTAEGDETYTATTPGFSVFAVGSGSDGSAGEAGSASADGDDGTNTDDGTDDDGTNTGGGGADGGGGDSAASDPTAEPGAGDAGGVVEQFGGSAAAIAGLLAVIALAVASIAVRRG